MNAHLCKVLTDGCYRCELNRDEMAHIEDENRDDAQVAWLDYRDEYARQHPWLEPRRQGRQMRRRDFIAGFIAGRES